MKTLYNNATENDAYINNYRVCLIEKAISPASRNLQHKEAVNKFLFYLIDGEINLTIRYNYFSQQWTSFHNVLMQITTARLSTTHNSD